MQAAEIIAHPPHYHWSFSGVFDSLDHARSDNETIDIHDIFIFILTIFKPKMIEQYAKRMGSLQKCLLRLS